MEKIFDKNEIFLSFNKQLSKNENIIFKLFAEHIISNNTSYIELSFKKLNTLLKLDQDNNIKNFFENFMKKKIIYKYNKFNFVKIEGHLYIISSYKIIDERFVISFSEDFFNIFNKDFNDFKTYKFNSLLQFDSVVKRNFFMILIQKDIINNFIDISLEELKNILEIENNYSRFYDFEKYILIPVIKEINYIQNIKIQYEKLKIRENGKIIGLRLFTKDKLDIQIHEQTQILMKEIETNVQNYYEFQKFLKKYIQLKGIDYVKKNIYYSKLHSKNKFDLFLIESMKYDYFSRRFKNKLKNDYKLIFFLDKVFKNTQHLRETFFQILKDSKFLHLSDIGPVLEETLDFINRKSDKLIKNFIPFYNEFIINLENTNECKYEDNIFVIFIEFNGIYDSHIYIFQKV